MAAMFHVAIWSLRRAEAIAARPFIAAAERLGSGAMRPDDPRNLPAPPVGVRK